MNVVESWWVARVADPTHAYNWTGNTAVVDDVTWLLVREADGTVTYLELTDAWELVRRTAPPQPSPTAEQVIVTFVNRDYTTPAGQPARQQVGLWLETPLVEGDDLTELAWEAAELLPELGWGGDAQTAWWASTVTLPNGTVTGFGR